jgi:hypothetical protein
VIQVKFGILAAFTVSYLIVPAISGAQNYKPGDWEKQPVDIVAVFKDGNPNALTDGDTFVQANSSLSQDNNYISVNFLQVFEYKPNGVLSNGPATLYTAESSVITGNASGGWGYSHSDIAPHDGFCPLNYNQTNHASDSYALDSTTQAIGIKFHLYAKAAGGSASTSASATIDKNSD